jgi:hypothetical protein
MRPLRWQAIPLFFTGLLPSHADLVVYFSPPPVGSAQPDARKHTSIAEIGTS